MGALNGEIVMTLPDAAGNPVFVVYIFFDPTTYALHDQTQLTSRGNRTGTVIIDNQTGRAQKLNTGTTNLNVSVVGDTYTAATLAANGYHTLQDLGPISPSVA
jgi:hypothetical protein